MSEQVQVPSEEKSFKELYENVCKERSRLQDELQESQRRVNICATERKELRGMYDDMESLSTRLSDKLEQNQNEYSQVIAELQHRLSASVSAEVDRGDFLPFLTVLFITLTHCTHSRTRRAT